MSSREYDFFKGEKWAKIPMNFLCPSNARRTHIIFHHLVRCFASIKIQNNMNGAAKQFQIKFSMSHTITLYLSAVYSMRRLKTFRWNYNFQWILFFLYISVFKFSSNSGFDFQTSSLQRFWFVRSYVCRFTLFSSSSLFLFGVRCVATNHYVKKKC